jgi:hypothetical protein
MPRYYITYFIVLILAALLSYWNGFDSEFIGDDLSRIQFNDSLSGSFSEAVSGTLADRPVLMATLWLNHQISGHDVFAYKITNVILHVIVGFLVLIFFVTLTDGDGEKFHIVPLLASIIFIVHPMNNLAINSIIQRGTIMAALFTCASFILFINYTRKGNRSLLYLSFLTYLLAVLSKENVILFPLILFIYQRSIQLETPHAQTRYSILGYVAILLIPFFYYFTTGLDIGGDLLSPMEYFLTQLKVIFTYFRILLFPSQLRFYYEVSPGLNFLDPLTWMVLVGHATMLLVCFWFVKKRDKVGIVLVSSFYLTLLPESSVIPIKHVIFEHRMYLPFIFILLLACHICSLLPKVKKYVIATFAFSSIILVMANLKRNAEIDTYLKWSLNTSKYIHANHDFNYYQLEKFTYLGNKSGLVFVNDLLTRDSENEIFDIFREIYTFAELPESRNRNILDRIRNELVSSKIRFHWAARRSFNKFYSVYIRQYVHGMDFLIDMDDLMFSQLEEILSSPKQYPSELDFYLKNLNILKQHYERDGIRVPKDAKRFVRILKVLELVYKKLPLGSAYEQCDSLVKNHPNWALKCIE